MSNGRIDKILPLFYDFFLFGIDNHTEKGYNIDAGVSQPQVRNLLSELLLVPSRKLQVSVSLLRKRKLCDEGKAHLPSFAF